MDKHKIGWLTLLSCLVLVSVNVLAAPAVVFKNNKHVYGKAKSDIELQIVSSKFVLNNKSVAKANLTTTFDKKVAVKITLTQTADAKMREFLLSHQGEELTVLFDNQIVSRIHIAGPVGKEFELIGLTANQARQFVKSIK